MELNGRCLEILRFLKEKDDFVAVMDIAAPYGLTARAIRYDLDRIESFLVKNGYGYLERRHNKGIKLPQSGGLDRLIASFVKTCSPQKYSYSREERLAYLKAKLLQAAAPLQLEYFQKELGVSKNTVLKELDPVADWLKARNLALVRKQRVGVWVEGAEYDKRKSIMELNAMAFSSDEVLSYLKENAARSKLNSLQFQLLFADIDLDFLDRLVNLAEQELGRKFSDTAYGNLITHLAVMVKRLLSQKNVNLPELRLDEGAEFSQAYGAAERLVARIEERYSLRVPRAEIHYITLHLLGAKFIKEDAPEWACDELYQVVLGMTEELEQIYGVQFGPKKGRIIAGLITHLRPTIYRIKFKLKLVNPIYDEIIKNYSGLFQNTRRVARRLEAYLGEPVDDQEISYLTMHYGAALENAAPLPQNVRAVIVCGTGIGTATLVASQLERKYQVTIVDIVSCRDLVSRETRDDELVISTVAIPGWPREDYIKVSPLLLREDDAKLQRRLERRYNAADQERELTMVSRLLDIVAKYCEIRDEQQLQYELLYELKRDQEDFGKRRSVKMLNELLTKDTIRLNLACGDWREAIHCGVALLLSRGAVEECYETCILKNFAEMGPYMVVAPGVVLAHARPENGVKKLAMSLITLERPVRFGHDRNDPVKLVITLAAADNESHLKALSQLMELLMNSGDLERVCQADNKEAVLEIIRRYSRAGQ
jgi:transcriptional antiterminator/mannitol/fructose-specific phosphotransferase system IIA component (Ntr-type)